MAYCSECGARLAEGARFCKKCGTRVLQTPTGSVNGAAAAGMGATAQTAGANAVEQAAGAGIAAAGQAVNTVRDVASAAAGLFEAPEAGGEFVIGTWSAPSLEAAVAQAVQEAQRVAQQTTRNAQAIQDVQGAARQAPEPLMQGGAQQSSAHYSSSGGGSAPVPKKKLKLPIILVVAVVVILFCAYVVPRFIPHPYDPNSHVALTSSMAASTGANGTSGASDTAASPTGISGSSPTPADGATPQGPPATPDDTAAGASFSTNEWPTLADFTWLTGETAQGNVPEGAMRIFELGAVTGGWKAYLFDSYAERLLHATIDVGQSDITVAFDWYYINVNATGEGSTDTSPTSFFAGTWDSGMLEATGPGRVTLAAFWQHDNRQYAAGSLMWPDGTVSTLVLVRP